MKKLVLLSIILFVVTAACLSGLLSNNQSDPKSGEKTIFEGVSYIKDVRNNPRPIVIHVVQVDLTAPGIQILVTPGDPEKELPLKARTTTDFLDEFDLQVAVNGDGFTPWHSLSPFNYYPHAGDPIDVLGFAASNGVVYSTDQDNFPTLYFGRANNKAVFDKRPGNISHAISGLDMIVRGGKPVKELGGSPEPRTAIGLNRSNKMLILLVVDGRQSNYSEGVTLDELAEILIFHGAHEAMNMDGGGSSTLVVEGDGGRPIIMNTPIDNRIPGRERPVGNHLGIYAKRP
jgi:hypothetical protein